MSRTELGRFSSSIVTYTNECTLRCTRNCAPHIAGRHQGHCKGINKSICHSRTRREPDTSNRPSWQPKLLQALLGTRESLNLKILSLLAKIIPTLKTASPVWKAFQLDRDLDYKEANIVFCKKSSGGKAMLHFEKWKQGATTEPMLRHMQKNHRDLLVEPEQSASKVAVSQPFFKTNGPCQSVFNLRWRWPMILLSRIRNRLLYLSDKASVVSWKVSFQDILFQKGIR